MEEMDSHAENPSHMLRKNAVTRKEEKDHDNPTDYTDELEIATDEEQEPDYLD